MYPLNVTAHSTLPTDAFSSLLNCITIFYHYCYIDTAILIDTKYAVYRSRKVVSHTSRGQVTWLQTLSRYWRNSAEFCCCKPLEYV